MIHLLIIHQVENYTAWKQIFDDASGIRKAAGEISFQVFKYHDEPDKIVHLSIWNEKQTAAQFFKSPAIGENKGGCRRYISGIYLPEPA